MKSFLLITLVCITAPCFSQRNPKMIDEIRAHTEGMAVWWAGHNSWIIKSGDLVVATDLYLENNERIAPAPITPEEMGIASGLKVIPMK